MSNQNKEENTKPTPFLKRVNDIEKSITHLTNMFNELKQNLSLMEKQIETLKKVLKR